VEAALSRDLYEIRFEVNSGFKQPALAKWDEDNGGNERAEVRFATVEGGDESSAKSGEGPVLRRPPEALVPPAAGM
jgi:hypothetical protein